MSQESLVPLSAIKKLSPAERLSNTLHNLINQGDVLARRDGLFVQGETETIFEGRHSTGVVNLQYRQTSNFGRVMAFLSDGDTTYNLVFGSSLEDESGRFLQFKKHDYSKDGRSPYRFRQPNREYPIGQDLAIVGGTPEPEEILRVIKLLEETTEVPEARDEVVAEYLDSRMGYSRAVQDVNIRLLAIGDSDLNIKALSEPTKTP